MSCFWDSLVAACNHHNLLLSRRTNLELCRELISLNKLTKSVTVNDEPLSKQCMNENFQAVKNYDVNGINSGHLTGTHDYFLCLIAELTSSSILFNFNGTNVKISAGDNNKIRLQSNSGHVWFVPS